MTPAILYVDDDRPNLDLFRRWFADEMRVLLASSGAEALEILAHDEVGVLVADQRMPQMTGIELLSRVGSTWPIVTRMLLTAYSDRELLLDAIQTGGVHDYVLKPWDAEKLGLRLAAGMTAYQRRRSLERTERECGVLREEVEARGGFSGIVGLGGGLARLAGMLDRVARTDATVMLRGESGTGKELLAREIHRRSLRAAGPFVRTNCAALSEGVLESELFGHEAGAFTGAQKARVGRFEQADEGTLFLDEIGDVSPGMQVRLLRVLQERELERVGGNRTIRVDIRVIAATHRNLEERVADGRFREDLFHRLNVVPLTIPPLRTRPEDIVPLARHFVAEFAEETGKRLTLADGAVEALLKYDWPGNVRELRNVIERAAVLADPVCELSREDMVFDFWDPAPREAQASASVFEEIAREEADKIRDALRQAGGSKARAARLLGLARTTLNDRIRRLGIQ